MEPPELSSFIETEKALDPYLTPSLISTIGKYVGYPLKMDTAAMLSFFYGKITAEDIERANNDDPDCLVHLGMKRTKPLLNRATVLTDSSARQLLNLIRLYFQKCLTNWAYDINEGNLVIFERFSEREYANLLGKIKGIQILKKYARTIPFICHNYVFGKEPWVNKYLNDLLGQPEEAFEILQSIGYRPLDAPAPGALVAYCTSSKVNHYGIVEYIVDDKLIVVRSKFGHQHIYLHLREVVPFPYGDQTFYFQPP
ncbi:MAG TPA: hypothetical protein VLF61_02905 [Rhabdochlamydiaceae bacterium]|nr:hypothetical protein [Rhabdochlamydiaceae bacterium]